MKPWWLWLWGIVACSLLALLFLIPFDIWAAAVFVCFGTMEGIGVFVGGEYPPLTQVIRKYVPYWVTLPAMWMFCVGAACSWWHFPHPWRITLLAGLLGWFNVHFIDAYYRIKKL